MTKGTCVIVGAGPGLGLGIARKFGANGYRIALVSRRRETLDPLVETLRQADVEARGFPADVLNHASLGRTLGEIERDFGPIEVLEYSPEPHTPPKDLREWMPMTMTLDEVDRRMRLSCYGAIVCANEVLPGMIARGSGTIIITTSGSGIEPIKTLCAVGMSMAAARNYAHSLHQQVKDKGVYAGTIILSLLVEPGDPYGDPDRLAEHYWALHTTRDRPELNVTTPIDPHQHHIDDMIKYGIEMPKD